MDKRIIVFDMDGTLIEPLEPITDDVKDALLRCKNRGYEIAIASGSTYRSIVKQIGADFILRFDYVFSENGTNLYKDGELLHSMDILDEIPSHALKELVEFALDYIVRLDIPIKRGTFVEHRKSLVNICPVGRNCSKKERDEFALLDKKRGIRNQFIKELKARFSSVEHPLRFVAGGQISIDVFPEQWNKTLVLTHLKGYSEIHFYGDNTSEGGNDYEIYNHPDVIGHTVKSYKDLISQLDDLLAH
ncbi:putative phosphomannomutase [Babesia divergens]|uniref:Phosphomannomutase n=1 Tax=Babesia divergens TaxID=32595 RepID=A0AAD9GD74_BABDI|nr:putative phosphomannomutase [Babesia divergens]